jgi:hypothetical protein
VLKSGYDLVILGVKIALRIADGEAPLNVGSKQVIEATQLFTVWTLFAKVSVV